MFYNSKRSWKSDTPTHLAEVPLIAKKTNSKLFHHSPHIANPLYRDPQGQAHPIAMYTVHVPLSEQLWLHVSHDCWKFQSYYRPNNHFLQTSVRNDRGLAFIVTRKTNDVRLNWKNSPTNLVGKAKKRDFRIIIISLSVSIQGLLSR